MGKLINFYVFGSEFRMVYLQGDFLMPPLVDWYRFGV